MKIPNLRSGKEGAFAGKKRPERKFDKYKAMSTAVHSSDVDVLSQASYYPREYMVVWQRQASVHWSDFRSQMCDLGETVSLESPPDL